MFTRISFARCPGIDAASFARETCAVHSRCSHWPCSLLPRAGSRGSALGSLGALQGMQYVVLAIALSALVLAMVACVGYGFAYRFGGLKAAALAYFGLNAAHFFLFAYPMLRPTMHT